MLAIVSDIAMNIGDKVTFLISVFVYSDKHPEVELLDHRVVAVSIF